jgi:pyrroloquinoline quinone biosynthesis protein B
MDPTEARPRTQSSIAVSADGHRWALFNASPDIRVQLDRLSEESLPVTRAAPFECIVFTDAELDHTLGLPIVREGRRLRIVATPAVESVLERDSRLLALARAFADVTVDPLPLDAPLPLLSVDAEPLGLTVEAFAVSGHAPRFASDSTDGHTVGLMIRDGHGGACAYVPGCGDITPAVERCLRDASLVLFDGTFWRDDELIALGVGTRRAREMGHLPISGGDGSLARLRDLDGKVVYLHINNTNPVLVERSPERAEVNDAGLVVGEDGMTFTV